MEIPDRAKCISLLNEHGVPAHIVAHSFRVAQVGIYLACHLENTGFAIDKKRVEAGALLHDISKMTSLEKGGDHAQEGACLLESVGFSSISDIVRQHVWIDPVARNRQICEVHLVHYADKRVRHTEIVSLQERFDDILKRYGTGRSKIESIKKLYRESCLLEERIFEKIEARPEDLQILNEHPPNFTDLDKLISR